MNVFCQVIESGNYQRASDVLNVTPSALSQTVTTLEYSLGFPLFERIGRKLIPTKEGLRLHREFRQHQAGFHRALKEISQGRVPVSGLLTIGAYLEFAKTHLSQVIKNFIEEFPDVQIKMVFDSPSRMQQAISRAQLDLCFSIYPSKEKSVSSEKVFQEELVLIAPKKFPPGYLNYESIMKMPMIDYYLNHQPIRRWLHLHFQTSPKKIPLRIFAATAEMVLSLVLEGAGIGVVPYYLVQLPEMQKKLTIVRPTTKKLTDHIWVLEKRSAEQSSLHRAFKEQMLMHFGG